MASSSKSREPRGAKKAVRISVSPSAKLMCLRKLCVRLAFVVTRRVRD
jgi:hypothetical protein